MVALSLLVSTSLQKNTGAIQNSATGLGELQQDSMSFAVIHQQQKSSDEETVRRQMVSELEMPGREPPRIVIDLNGGGSSPRLPSESHFLPSVAAEKLDLEQIEGSLATGLSALAEALRDGESNNVQEQVDGEGGAPVAHVKVLAENYRRQSRESEEYDDSENGTKDSVEEGGPEVTAESGEKSRAKVETAKHGGVDRSIETRSDETQQSELEFELKQGDRPPRILEATQQQRHDVQSLSKDALADDSARQNEGAKVVAKDYRWGVRDSQAEPVGRSFQVSEEYRQNTTRSALSVNVEYRSEGVSHVEDILHEQILRAQHKDAHVGTDGENSRGGAERRSEADLGPALLGERDTGLTFKDGVFLDGDTWALASAKKNIPQKSALSQFTPVKHSHDLNIPPQVIFSNEQELSLRDGEGRWTLHVQLIGGEVKLSAEGILPSHIDLGALESEANGDGHFDGAKKHDLHRDRIQRSEGDGGIDEEPPVSDSDARIRRISEQLISLLA